MAKTIIERMCSITEKMKDTGEDGKKVLKIDDVTLKGAEADLRALRKILGMNTMQVLILTSIVKQSSRYNTDMEDISSFMGMDYLRFLTLDEDMEELRKRGYIRADKEGRIRIPREVLKSLKRNEAIQPEPTVGLTTAVILNRIKKAISIREDGECTDEELFDDIKDILKDNPDTSISRTCEKHIKGIVYIEAIVFFLLIYRYWFEDDDMVGWHNIEGCLDEDRLAYIRSQYRVELLSLQRRGIIEYTGEDSLIDKDYFHIKDDIKNEIFKDLGGVRLRERKVSASRKVESASICKKELFYNTNEGRQIAQLQELLSGERLNIIRTTMKAKGMRSGFTCLFYGTPGSGKTETVYQIARESGRDIFVVDVAQIKSCWVGDSEKNIKRVFDKYRTCVESGGVVPILLFNEADAIFGIRKSGAEGAVDKMENSIQNIILQEMENLDGILIATTNLTENLDKAFERRFLYKVKFSNPSSAVKCQIWNAMMPELTDADAHYLAEKYDFSGGQIENVVRKRTIQTILTGKEPDMQTILTFCCEEMMGAKNQQRKIGF